MEPRDSLFILGRESQLAFTELRLSLAAETNNQPTKINDQVVLASLTASQVEEMQSKLAGWVKIAEVVESVKDKDAIVSAVDRFLSSFETKATKKIPYAVTAFSPEYKPLEKELLAAIKAWFAQKDMTSRFLIGKQSGLSSVQVKGQHVLRDGFELLLVPDKDRILVARTIAVQDFQMWIKHDYGRPFANPVRGMVPPKLARSMVVIAESLLKIKGQAVDRPTVLDPFCGEGTILAEALAIGCNVIGSDIDQHAVTDTEKNLEWFKKTFLPDKQNVKIIVKQGDIANLDRVVDLNSVEIIVTEPYLGAPAKQQLSEKEKSTIKRTYSDLFTKLLEQGQKVLKEGGILGVIVPTAQTGRFSQRLVDQSKLDSCEKFGYTRLEGPIMYSRPDAKIGRELYFFRKDGMKR